jgi:ABC-type transporter lipoprotein component MlaA
MVMVFFMAGTGEISLLHSTQTSFGRRLASYPVDTGYYVRFHVFTVVTMKNAVF